MMKQLRKSNSLCLSLDGDDLETPQDTPMVRATPSEDIELQQVWPRIKGLNELKRLGNRWNVACSERDVLGKTRRSPL